MVIKQEISNKELIEYSNNIINYLSKLNIAEKYKVINSLHSTLLDLIKEEGIVIELKHD